MNGLPRNAKTIDLLRWVETNHNQPFDPNMVVSLSTGHSTDWEWQAVEGQMEDLRRQGYILRVRQDASGSTYWVITESGTKYLRALERFENSPAGMGQTKPPDSAPEEAISQVEVVVPAIEMPAPTPKAYLWPFLERKALWIRRSIKWEDMPSQLAAQLTYDLLKYSVIITGTALVGGVSLAVFYLIRFLLKRTWSH